MKRWRIQIDELRAVPVWFTIGVISGIGTDELASCFLRTIQREMAASHCTIFALGEDGRASMVSAASSYGDAASSTASEYFRQGFDRQDSNMVWLAAKKTPKRSQAWMSQQNADEVANATYRRVCYGEVGIRERVSVLLLLDNGRRIALSFYRNLAFPPFQPADLQWLDASAPVLMSAIMAHIRQTSPSARRTPLSERILSELPHRERQVLSHVLAGHTTRETAERLQLAQTTVLTYRYRAFAKLGVKTQRELLALVRHEASTG